MSAQTIRLLATGSVILYTLYLILQTIMQFPTGIYFWLWGMPGVVLNVVSAYFLAQSLRQVPKNVDMRISTFLISLAGTVTMAISAVLVTSPVPEFLFVSEIRILGGMLSLLPYPFILWAYFCLRNNLTIIPEAHHVVAHGIYAYSRHPLYVCYIAWDLANLLMFPSMPIIVLSVLHTSFLLIRMHREESLLLATLPGYRQYHGQTGLLGKRFRSRVALSE